MGILLHYHGTLVTITRQHGNITVLSWEYRKNTTEVWEGVPKRYWRIPVIIMFSTRHVYTLYEFSDFVLRVSLLEQGQSVWYHSSSHPEVEATECFVSFPVPPCCNMDRVYHIIPCPFHLHQSLPLPAAPFPVSPWRRDHPIPQFILPFLFIPVNPCL